MVNCTNNFFHIFTFGPQMKIYESEYTKEIISTFDHVCCNEASKWFSGGIKIMLNIHRALEMQIINISITFDENDLP